MFTLKAQGSRLKAQGSRLKKSNPKPLAKSSAGFTLLELIITVAILSIVTAIAVPNFKATVQNNRIKSTTNHIIASLQFARQTAAINKIPVTACTPLPGSTESCASSYNWNNGITLLQGNVKVAAFTPPPEPVKPDPPILTLNPLPTITPKPEEPKGVAVYCRASFKEIRTHAPGKGGYNAIRKCEVTDHLVFHEKYSNGKISPISYSRKEIGKTVIDNWQHCYIEIADGKRPDRLKGEGTGACSASGYQAATDAEKDLTIKNAADYDAKMNAHNQSKKAFDNTKQANEQLEANHQKNLQSYQHKLIVYEQEKKAYDEELAATPPMTVTADKAEKILAGNPFAITVSNNLKSGALVYKHDKVLQGGGEIYIEDARGKGKHSRTICVNMLGNLKVIKGDKSCP